MLYYISIVVDEKKLHEYTRKLKEYLAPKMLTNGGTIMTIMPMKDKNGRNVIGVVHGKQPFDNSIQWWGFVQVIHHYPQFVPAAIPNPIITKQQNTKPLLQLSSNDVELVFTTVKNSYKTECDKGITETHMTEVWESLRFILDSALNIHIKDRSEAFDVIRRMATYYKILSPLIIRDGQVFILTGNVVYNLNKAIKDLQGLNHPFFDKNFGL
jgi:hypothetical protein